MNTRTKSRAGLESFDANLPGDAAMKKAMEGSIDEVNWSLRFVIWQVAVGWSLSRSMQKGLTNPINLTENMKPSHNSEMA